MHTAKLGFLAAIAVSVAAQTTTPASLINDFPSCAVGPAIPAIQATGCGTNVACVCNTSTFLTSVIPAVQAACNPSDFQKALQVAVQLCAENGVTITVPSFESSTSASASIASASASVASSSTASTTQAVSTYPTPLRSSASTTSVPTAGTRSTSAVSPAITANVAATDRPWAAAGLIGAGILMVAL